VHRRQDIRIGGLLGQKDDAKRRNVGDDLGVAVVSWRD
jgi:hypothetical protein